MPGRLDRVTASVIDAPATILQYRRMVEEQREDFERRLLALVRSQMDQTDERYPDGWVITDFVVTARGYVEPDPDAAVHPWAGGPYPGWPMHAWTVGSSPEYQIDLELLRSALESTTRLQNDWLEQFRAAVDENDEADEH
jgi:hypothetical protein